MVVGIGSNTREEFLACWALLWFAWKSGVLRENIFCDSNIVINWANGFVEMQAMQLTHWLNKLQHLTDDFTNINFMHVNMELNM